MSDMPCSFIKLAKGRLSYMDDAWVHHLSSAEMETMFRNVFAVVYTEAPAARATLARLQSLSPATASALACKADQIRSFVFRLIFPRSHLPSEPSSFVALSYCWPTKPIATYDDPAKHALPISPLLFAALTRELQPSEGIWCDQICIDQKNIDEKAVSIRMMDIVYAKARRTVIVLADIEIEKEEQKLLESYMLGYLADFDPENPALHVPKRLQIPPYMESHPDLHNLYWKILGSRWFQRAWCAHEMRMGRQHIFLMPCKDGDTILRMTSRFFEHLVILATEVPLVRQCSRSVTVFQRNSAHQTVLDGNSKSSLNTNILGTFNDINQLGCGGDPDPRLSPEQRAQSAIRDKLVITLNTTASGLTLTKAASRLDASDMAINVSKSIEQCFKSITMISLATNDPVALCTTGGPISLGSSMSTHSWIRWYIPHNSPAIVDNQVLEMAPLHIIIDEKDTFIELEMCDFRPGTTQRGPFPVMIQRSTMLIKALIKTARTPGNLYYDWQNFISLNEETRRLFVLTLACVLQNGIPWILNTFSFSEESRAFTFCTIAIASLLPLVDKPPLCLEMSSEAEVQEIGELEATEAAIFDWVQTTEGAKAADNILQFTQFINQKSLPQPWQAATLKPYRPFILSRSENRKHVIFLHSMYERAALTVPKGLTENKFDDLARVWFLEPVKEKGGLRFHLLGRQRIFGPSIAGLSHAGPFGAMRVYGPRIR